jgi:hypothetical protein
MTEIHQVIGWKFNNQQGMSTKDNVITEFPGGIPSQADQDTWTAEYLVEFPEGYDEWKESMQETDNGMPRYLEDLITANSDFTIPEKMKTRYDDKVALRATKPGE